MRIALIGYGKMGKIIEEIALQRGHEIVLKIHTGNIQDFNLQTISKADVAIEFTSPGSAFKNVCKCIEYGVPVVCGTTGWYKKLEEAQLYCRQKEGGFLFASNFSIGVAIFFEINMLLAHLMSRQPEYEVAIKEIHHTQKKDAPSGTAVTIAEQILSKLLYKKSWVNRDSTKKEELSIVSERIDPAPGIHSIKYSSATDDIEIMHTAHNRKGFAFGAVLAAEYIAGKSGIFTMKDVLNF